MTFTFRMVEERIVPEVASTLTEKLVAAVSAAVFAGVGLVLGPDPQPVKRTVTQTRRVIPASQRRRLRSTGPMTSMAANPTPGKEIQNKFVCDCERLCGSR